MGRCQALTKLGSRCHNPVYDFETCYTHSGPKQECPVCFDSVPASRWALTPCSHGFCTPCLAKCKSCPLCRRPISAPKRFRQRLIMFIAFDIALFAIVYYFNTPA